MLCSLYSNWVKQTAGALSCLDKLYNTVCFSRCQQNHADCDGDDDDEDMMLREALITQSCNKTKLKTLYSGSASISKKDCRLTKLHYYNRLLHCCSVNIFSHFISSLCQINCLSQCSSRRAITRQNGKGFSIMCAQLTWLILAHIFRQTL